MSNIELKLLLATKEAEIVEVTDEKIIHMMVASGDPAEEEALQEKYKGATIQGVYVKQSEVWDVKHSTKVYHTIEDIKRFRR